MTGAFLGAAIGLGIVLIACALRRWRRPSLESRVLPYVRDIHPELAQQSYSAGDLARSFGRRSAGWLGELLGGANSVRRRLDRIGDSGSVEDFRQRQIVWGALGFAICAILSLLIWSTVRGSALILLIVCLLGFVAGTLACDRYLSSRVHRHEERAAEELPAVADLLALAVAAGESPVAGLERVLRVATGDLADDLSRVLGEIRTGRAISDAFMNLSASTSAPSIARFCEGLAVAVERGTPLVEVLHAQATDVRQTARRQLIEAGGRKEIAMMLPVVFLVLPVTVVFAFFPGYIGLTMTT